MKKLVLLMLLVSVSVFSQVKKDNTVQWEPAKETDLTETEYNYLTKGLKIQKESGLDMKKGYMLNELLTRKVDRYSFKGKIFKDIEKDLVKAFSIEVYSEITGNTYYLALPAVGKPYLNEYFETVQRFEPPLMKAYTLYLSDMFRLYFAELVEFKAQYYKNIKNPYKE